MSDNVQIVKWSYSSVCWQCKSDISSNFCKRCPICGWYFCRNCGACSRSGGCIGSLCKTPEEYAAARAEFIRAQRYDGISPKEWLASFVAKTERERAEALRREAEKEAEAARKKAEEEATAHKAKQLEDEYRAKRIAILRESSPIGTSVYSVKYGACAVVEFRSSSDGKYEYIGISTSEGIKEFILPDCFDRGFLSIEQKNSREGLD